MIESLCLTILLACPAFLEEPAVTAPASSGPSASAVEWAELGSPWYAVRRRAERRLLCLDPGDGLRVAAELLRDRDPELRRAGVAWLLSRLERGEETLAEGELLADAMARESDIDVLDLMVHAAARSQTCVERLKKLGSDGGFSARLLDRILDARVVILFERVMHEGRIPGFYDGQFQQLHELDESAFLRMLKIAWDPRVSFVVRCLAIMAVHEPRRPDLPVFLEPLIVDAAYEVDLLENLAGHQLGWRVIREYMRVKLSQYARFSLAKAGFPEPINEKIELLKREAASSMGVAETLHGGGVLGALNRERDAERWLYYLEQAMDCYFELGYHHQQLDHYVEAELAYRVITEHEQMTHAKRWAYYNLACMRALQGRTDEAITELENAIEAGFKDATWAQRDGDLKSLHADPRFQKVFSRLETLAGDEENEEPVLGGSYGR